MDQAPTPLPVSAVAAPQAAEAVLRPLGAVLSRSALPQAAAAFCAELAEQLHCDRVTVGLLAADGLRLAGSSHPTPLQAGQPASTALVDAMQEALDQRQAVSLPQLQGLDAITLAHRQLAATGCACTVPLVDEARVVGAMTLERGAPAFTAAEIALLSDVSRLSGPVLELKRRLAMPWHERLVAGARERLAQPSRRMVAWGAGALVLAAALAVPVPWRVSAPARLEGSVQRAVVAATDGFLQQANVRPGDRVKEGQVLAQLSSQDLELERKRRESEMRQHENALRAAEARNDRTQMVISQSRAAEAQALLALAEGQLERSQLTAPFDGVVIRGDLAQKLGAPVQKGEVLLVLAPSDSFRLIVEVDESDIAAVRPGQHGQLALAARPEEPLRFTTRRIVPVATTADGRNYFEVEASPDQAQANLRPGLSGVAKIEVGEKPLAWLLLHRFATWLRLAVWTLSP